MFCNALGLIIADHRKIQLGELTRPRALAAVPFGGRYRIIDFMLSNMVNSGINTVGVIALNKYKSLMDHLGTGSNWDLDRNSKGLSILPPYINSLNVEHGGEADDLSGLLDYFKSNTEKYVIIANTKNIFSTTLNDFIQAHEESGADISIMYNRDSNRYGVPSLVFSTDRKGFVTDILYDPEKTSVTRCALGVTVLERELLIDLLSEMIARGGHDFSIEGILRMYQNLRVYGFEYKGHALRINSVVNYFKASMRLLEDEIQQALFWSGMPVFTKVKDEAPALYTTGNSVSNCMVSDGCKIDGSIKDSVLFRGVTVSSNTRIDRCVVFQDAYISEGVELENVILDKNCVIRPGVKLIGQADYPVVIGKGAIV